MDENNYLLALYTDQLQDLYSAEQQILKALPKMAETAVHPELKRAFHDHDLATREHVQRLDQIFQKLNKPHGSETCKGMQGIIAEGEELMKKYKDADVLDAALIAAAQRVEHYEMAGYGCVRTYADMLDLGDQSKLLQQTLDNEAATNEKLTEIAESAVNADAMKR